MKTGQQNSECAAIWDESSLEGLGRELPAVARVVREHGGTALKEYCRTFRNNTAQPVDDPADFVRVCRSYAESLYGAEIAGLLADQLSRVPVVLTANHHGVDCHPLFIQGNIIFSLAVSEVGASLKSALPMVPVLGFGSVSLGNLVYSRGLMLSRLIGGTNEVACRVKLAVFPASMSRVCVHATAAFTEKQALRVTAQMRSLHRDGAVSRLELETVEQLIQEHYLDAQILERNTYSDQASLLNGCIWEQMVGPPAGGSPRLVSLEIERIAARLLVHDFSNSESMASRVLFDPEIRAAVLAELNGAYGCWDTEQLHNYLSRTLTAWAGRDPFGQSGTLFFWGVTGKGRLARLNLVHERGLNDERGALLLQGYGDDHQLLTFRYQPEALAEALESGRIIPSLFTTFLVIAFSRGTKCYGGFWQSDYLPGMQQGLAQAFARVGLVDWAEKVSSVHTANYVTGMSVALAAYADGARSPAGLVELLAAGGLSRDDMQRIGRIRVDEANTFGLDELLKEYCLDKSGCAKGLIETRVLDRVAEQMLHINMG